jgi:hypothetical protein
MTDLSSLPTCFVHSRVRKRELRYFRVQTDQSLIASLTRQDLELLLS